MDAVRVGGVIAQEIFVRGQPQFAAQGEGPKRLGESTADQVAAAIFRCQSDTACVPGLK